MPFKKPAGGDRYRSFCGEFRFLSTDDAFNFHVEIWLLNDLVNRNNWKYINLEQHRALFAGTPILIAYTNGGKGIGDGHNFRMETDPRTGEEAPSFTGATAERIVGALSDDQADVRLEQRDGHTWIVGRGRLWKWYAKELVEKIERDARQGRSMSISIETLVTKAHMEGDVEVEEEYKILGTTILGDHVTPAVAGAHIAALQEMKQFNELKVRAASYNGKPQANSKPNNQHQDRKGVKTLNLFSKNQLKELQSRFAEHTVLAAGSDDNGIHVCMIDKDGAPIVYTMSGMEDTIVPEGFHRDSVSAEFSCGVRVDAFDAIERALSPMTAENRVLREQNEKLTADLAAANNSVKAMQEAEDKRRKAAAKAAAEAFLEKLNENRAEIDRISVEIIKPVLERAEAGGFNEICNEDGEWCGDRAAEDAVCERAMRQQMEIDKRNAEQTRNAQKKTYAFEVAGKDGTNSGSEIENIYNNLMK